MSLILIEKDKEEEYVDESYKFRTCERHLVCIKCQNAIALGNTCEHAIIEDLFRIAHTGKKHFLVIMRLEELEELIQNNLILKKLLESLE
ncbi:hypothetical protein ES705_22053 [subsurface metagenome]